SGRQNITIVLDYRERLVEMVKEPLPLGVALRAAEALGVRLERVPFDQQEIFSVRFDRRTHFHAEKPRRCRDKWLRLAHRLFESAFAAAPDIEDGVFEDHVPIDSNRAGQSTPRLEIDHPARTDNPE